MLDVDRFGIRHEFIKTAKRTLRIVTADISEAKTGVDVEETVGAAVRGIDREDLVRVVLTGERDITPVLDTAALYDIFMDKFSYFEVKDATRVRILADDFKNDRSLKGEFIRSVIADESISDDMKEKIITAGLRALLGENID